METHEQVKQGNSQNDFMEFFKGLDKNYQRYLIDQIQKKPPDNKIESTEADSARQVGDPKSR
ncbi:hypothetical protein IGI39_004001 [Enterococcus sp. AZ135]|uniref:hypothetical protein n=1 Tax=unclassified Enterococcus TaxID=2608891 RepID=UPI003F219BBE